LQLLVKKIYFGRFKGQNQTTMGYIPIFVALLGLVVLYTVYTLNLIKPRKGKLTAIINKMADLSRDRKAIILKTAAAEENSSMNEAAEKLKKTSTDRFQSFNKEEELIQVINSGLAGLEEGELKTNLVQMNTNQEALMKQLKLASNDYNGLISKAPASFVASVFGYKKF